jgi:hypothetical protein
MIIGDAVTKAQFATAARAAATQLAVLMDGIKEIQEAYVSRGYAVGAADPILDADIAAAKITAADLAGFLAPAYLASRLVSLMAEGTVTGTIQGNVIVDKLRSDM